MKNNIPYHMERNPKALGTEVGVRDKVGVQYLQKKRRRPPCTVKWATDLEQLRKEPSSISSH